MRLVFFGTPDFAVPSFHALRSEGHDIAAAVTQPDRPKGRSRSRLVASAIKQAAEEAGIAVLQPERPVGDVFARKLQRLEPDLGVVVAYGHILKPEILAIPTLGMINVHASILPRWRGAAPIQAAIRAGDRVTGVSIMRMEAGLDSGPVLYTVETPISPAETFGNLRARLAELGARALIQSLENIAAGTVRPRVQDDAAATYAPKVTRGLAQLDWQSDAEQLARDVRAFDPTPGAWTELNGQRIKLFGARAADDGDASPGTVLSVGSVLRIACGRGVLEVEAVQQAGKKPLSIPAWARGRAIAPGQRFA